MKRPFQANSATLSYIDIDTSMITTQHTPVAEVRKLPKNFLSALLSSINQSITKFCPEWKCLTIKNTRPKQYNKSIIKRTKHYRTESQQSRPDTS